MQHISSIQNKLTNETQQLFAAHGCCFQHMVTFSKKMQFIEALPNQDALDAWAQHITQWFKKQYKSHGLVIENLGGENIDKDAIPNFYTDCYINQRKYSALLFQEQTIDEECIIKFREQHIVLELPTQQFIVYLMQNK